MNERIMECVCGTPEILKWMFFQAPKWILISIFCVSLNKKVPETFCFCGMENGNEYFSFEQQTTNKKSFMRQFFFPSSEIKKMVHFV